MEKYELLLSVANNTLQTLIHLLEKGEVHVKEKGLEEKVLLEAKLAPDMFHFTKQIQVATDDIRRNTRLLAGKEHIKMEDSEVSFEELKKRVSKTLEIINELNVEDFEGADERKITLFWMGENYVTGKDFLSEFAFNNFFFHVVTAYDILRKEGVAIGKMDFITQFSMKAK